MKKESITAIIPDYFEIMNDFDYLKIRELVKTGLEIVSIKMDEMDNTAKLLWPILQCATDLFNRYTETPDALLRIESAREKAKAEPE